MVSMEKLQQMIEAELEAQSERFNERTPYELYAPVTYSLSMGGKRLRPVLLLMACNLFSDKIEKALPAALALELFHNFTLLHDDIMDKAALRRGKPTVHIKFSENHAILSGDAMAFLSYHYLLKCPSPNLTGLLDLFTTTALEVCEGQQYDMDFEARNDVTEAEYLEMIRLKTAVLLGCSLKAGALLGNAGAEEAGMLYDLGINLGMAFQLQDDLLDTFGNKKSFGKEIGGDISANKKTFLLIKAMEKASPSVRKRLDDWLARKGEASAEKIEGVTAIYNKLNIKRLTEKKIDAYFRTASEILNKLPVDRNKKEALKGLSEKMLGRNH